MFFSEESESNEIKEDKDLLRSLERAKKKILSKIEYTLMKMFSGILDVVYSTIIFP